MKQRPASTTSFTKRGILNWMTLPFAVSSDPSSLDTINKLGLMVCVSVQLPFYAKMNSSFLRCSKAPAMRGWRWNHMISGCWQTGASLVGGRERSKYCLLYTSDAADEEDSV